MRPLIAAEPMLRTPRPESVPASMVGAEAVAAMAAETGSRAARNRILRVMAGPQFFAGAGKEK